MGVELWGLYFLVLKRKPQPKMVLSFDQLVFDLVLDLQYLMKKTSRSSQVCTYWMKEDRCSLLGVFDMLGLLLFGSRKESPLGRNGIRVLH